MGDVGIYARISLDRHDGEGVARQLADCHELAAARGWDRVVEYVDNDISAFRGKRRPAYERLLADLNAGTLSAVIAYHPDRLYRRMHDLLPFIKAVQAAGAEVATVKAGDVDLSTATGRMVAKIIGSIAEGDSERKAELISRAKRERAVQGRPAGGGARPFGLTADRTELVPAEADALRQAADAIVAGATLRSQADVLNAAGIYNTGGGHWTVGTLRRVLTTPYVAGLRTYHGQIVGDAAWPAILDRGVWEILRAEAHTRRRPGRPPTDKYLLTGLLVCSRCGRPLWANRTRTPKMEYRCAPRYTTKGRGCGRISISATAAERYVIDTVGGWFDHPEFRHELDAYLTFGDVAHAETQAELDEIDRRQIVLAQRWASGNMTDEAHDAAQAVFADRRRAIEDRLAGTVMRSIPSVTAGQLAAAWQVFTIPERREAIRTVAHTPIPVAPGVDDTRTRVPIAVRFAALRPIWE